MTERTSRELRAQIRRTEQTLEALREEEKLQRTKEAVYTGDVVVLERQIVAGGQLRVKEVTGVLVQIMAGYAVLVDPKGGAPLTKRIAVRTVPKGKCISPAQLDAALGTNDWQNIGKFSRIYEEL